MVRRAPQMGHVAVLLVGSGCIKVVQPLVEQNRRLPDVVRRIRRRADAPKLDEGLWVRGCISSFL
jgi:hypothetical protein